MTSSDFFFIHLRKFMAAGAVLIGVGLAALFGGCSGEQNAVSGQVTSGDKTVQWGTVSVVGSDNRVYSAPISPDGRYEVKGLPPGPIKGMSVSSPNPKAQFGTPPAASKSPDKSPQPGQTPTGNQRVAAKDPIQPQVPNNSPVLPASVKWFPIPGKYADPSTSGLTPQGNRFDIKVD